MHKYPVMKKLVAASVLSFLVMIASQAQSCFTPVWGGNGLDHMNIYVTSATINGANLQAGDVIGVFDGNSCVGMATLTMPLFYGSYLSVYASKDDPDTPEKDGYTENNAISFRYCLNGGTAEISEVSSAYVSGTGIFTVSGTSQVQLSFTSAVPTVITGRVNTIASTHVVVTGCQILNDGGSPVIVKGVCWSTSPGPTADLVTRTEDGHGSLDYSSTPSELTPGTTYYLRAYATNSTGVGYGNEIIFKTYNSFIVGDIDGNYYNTITIGTQTWLAENLQTTRFNNGDFIGTTDPPTLDISGETEPRYQWPYNGNEGNVVPYGRLYTWYTVIDSRNLCPEGYHVPGDSEWNTLRDFLVSIGYGYMGGAGIGKSMAETYGWNSSDLIGAVGNDQVSNNSSGFTGLPAG